MILLNSVPNKENVVPQETVREPTMAGDGFSIKLFVIAFVFTAAVLAWLTWSTYDLYTRDTTIREQDWRTGNLRNRIIHLDEVLTMSARMAAATGDPRWEKRYRIFEPQLDEAINETKKLTPSQMVADTDVANIKLVGMENRAFTLVRDGHAEEAQAVLSSEEYETQKRIYADGMSKFLAQFESLLNATHRSARKKALFSAGAGIVVLTILLFSGLAIMRWLYKAHAVLLNNITKRKQAEDVLRKAHHELEVRVQERTADLTTANSTLAKQIAERGQVEASLRESEERYRELFENAQDAIYVHDVNGKYLSVNGAAERLCGYSRHELIGRNFAEFMAPEYAELIRINNGKELEGKGLTAYEIEVLAKDGRSVPVEVSTRLIYEKGIVIGMQGIARDITDRKRAEEALRDSEARKRTILESAMDCIITMDHEGLVVDWNPAAEKTFGYAREEAIGREMAELIIPLRFREHHRQGLARNLATGKGRVIGQRLELSAERSDGTEFPVELTITRIESKGAPMFTGYVRDITERKKAERRLSAQYTVTRALAESNTISEGASKILQAVCESLGFEFGALWTVDRGANVLRCSQTWQALDAGADEFEDVCRESVFASGIGLPGRVWNDSEPVWIHDVVKDTNFPRSSIAARAGLHSACAFPIRLRSEVLGVVEFFNRSIRESDPALLAMMGTIGSQIGQFIERKRVEEALGESEEQLRQSQKLEAIGQLAGGVAHDFNNLFTAIIGYSALALKRLGNDHPIKSYLEEIKKAGDRAANLTRQLLAFSRKQLLQPLSLNLNDVVSDLTKMLKRLIGEDVQFVSKLSPELSRIKADPGQIEQVLMNLVVNARDAMPTGGKLTIETANAEFDGSYASKHVGVTAGRYVMLAVSDTGTGMDHDTQTRIFEPFFTTKEQGKGTGLGLSTVYGIVKQSGGHVWVYSEPEKGTSFKVYLPELEDEKKHESVPVADANVHRGSETVLLVEDEEMVRNLASQLLEESGYRVLAATGGAEAISLCKEYKETIDLLITDVVMPKMSGKDVAEQLITIHPEAKVLFMSGYTDEAIVHHGIVDSHIAFIQKPFSENALGQKIRDVLDAA